MSDSATTRPNEANSNLLPQCVVCACSGCDGPVEFSETSPGVWEASFRLKSAHQGHPGLVHGGVLATLMDGAMAVCMHRRGLHAVTAELAIRYHKPVEVGQVARLRAEVAEQRGPLYFLKAELLIGQDVHVSATSKFVDCPALRMDKKEADAS